MKQTHGGMCDVLIVWFATQCLTLEGSRTGSRGAERGQALGLTVAGG